jgi:hypothetical protein
VCFAVVHSKASLFDKRQRYQSGFNGVLQWLFFQGGAVVQSCALRTLSLSSRGSRVKKLECPDCHAPVSSIQKRKERAAINSPRTNDTKSEKRIETVDKIFSCHEAFDTDGPSNKGKENRTNTNVVCLPMMKIFSSLHLLKMSPNSIPQVI